MKYVIMADGDMKRWHADCNIPKHLLRVGDETLLERLVRQLHGVDVQAEIIITSHNGRYEVRGATRYEPRDNHLEIDRFTWELIEDDICFLYGDTYYTDQAIRAIHEVQTEEIHFVGTEKSIVALIAHDAALLRQHILRVKEAFLKGKLSECRGWQVYQSYAGLPFGKPVIGPAFTLLSDGTCGFNSWQEYQDFLKRGNEYDGHI